MEQPPQDIGQWLGERLGAARAGSKNALGQTLEAYRQYLLLVANQELAPALRAKGGASDLVQETFLEAQRDFGGFEGESEGELRAWLRRLLLNNVANFARRYRATAKRAVRREVSLPPDSSGGEAEPLAAALVAPGPTPSGQAIAGEQAERIQRALERLPDDYQRVIRLRHQEQCSFEEVGRLMGRTPNAARMLWLRAVEKLQQELERTP